ncbi:MAG: hypothetical protein PVF59_11305 [Desulfobacterales bacterium]|jgi:YHS domain-containing protein
MTKLLILALVGYVFYRALRNWIHGSSRPEVDRGKTAAGEVDDVLIQDPVCQTYFARRNGVHLRHDGQDLYFCSNRCRERFLDDKTPPEDRAGEG